MSGCRRTCGHSGSRPAGRQAERRAVADLFGQCQQCAADLVGFDARQNADRAEVMVVQRLGQPTQNRVVRVGGDAIDDELVTRHAERQRRAILE